MSLERTEHHNQKAGPADVVITGIPRSGTSLLTVLLNQLPDVVALNEATHDVRRLPAFFREARNAILAGRPVREMLGPQGSPATDTYAGGVAARDVVINKQLSESFVLCTKSPAPFLVNLYKILRDGYAAVAIVRHPVDAILSWHRPEVETSITVSRMTSMSPSGIVGLKLWNGMFAGLVPAAHESQIQWRARLWNCLAAILHDVRDSVLILRYEDLIASAGEVLRQVAAGLDTQPCTEEIVVPPQPPRTPLPSDLRMEIADAVGQLCPMRSQFGYQ